MVLVRHRNELISTGCELTGNVSPSPDRLNHTAGLMRPDDASKFACAAVNAHLRVSIPPSQVVWIVAEGFSPPGWLPLAHRQWDDRCAEGAHYSSL